MYLGDLGWDLVSVNFTRQVTHCPRIARIVLCGHMSLCICCVTVLLGFYLFIRVGFAFVEGTEASDSAVPQFHTKRDTLIPRNLCQWRIWQWRKLRTLGAEADHPGVVVEDAPSGIKAGVAAGAHVLAVCTSFPREMLEGLGAEWIVEDLTHVRAEPIDGRVKVTILD